MHLNVFLYSELRNTQELLKIESLANMQELEDMKGKLKLSQGLFSIIHIILS